PQGQGHRPAARRDQLPHPGVGRAGPRLPRLARVHHDRRRAAAAARPAPLAARPAPPAAATHRRPARHPPGHRVTGPARPDPRPPPAAGSRTHRKPGAGAAPAWQTLPGKTHQEALWSLETTIRLLWPPWAPSITETWARSAPSLPGTGS